MKRLYDAPALTALQFCGTVTAAFSHDFKNALAIIKENAGLLGDLTAMAEHGRPLDLQRLTTLADRIGRQVQRADDMTRQLNRFAHSTDRPEAETDIETMLDLAVTMASRPAALKRVALELIPAPKPLRVTTFPFALQQMLYRCIESLLDAAGSGGRITLGATQRGDEIQVRLTPGTADGNVPPDDAAPARTAEIDRLAATLADGLDYETQTASWCLRWYRHDPAPAPEG